MYLKISPKKGINILFLLIWKTLRNQSAWWGVECQNRVWHTGGGRETYLGKSEQVSYRKTSYKKHMHGCLPCIPQM
jgi:hypothetical protein